MAYIPHYTSICLFFNFSVVQHLTIVENVKLKVFANINKTITGVLIKAATTPLPPPQKKKEKEKENKKNKKPSPSPPFSCPLN